MPLFVVMHIASHEGNRFPEILNPAGPFALIMRKTARKFGEAKSTSSSGAARLSG